MAKKDKQPSAKAKAGKKQGKNGRKGKRGPANPLGRLLGSVSGLLVLAYASYGLLTGSMDMLGAGQLALIALAVALAVEKIIVPFAVIIMGPPREEEPPAPVPAPPRRRGR